MFSWGKERDCGMKWVKRKVPSISNKKCCFQCSKFFVITYKFEEATMLRKFEQKYLRKLEREIIFGSSL